MCHFQINETARFPRSGIARHPSQRFVAIGKRGLENANHGARPTAIVKNSPKARLELERLIEIIDGVVALIFAEKSVPAVEIGFGGGLELDRLVIIRNGVIVVALAEIGRAHV